jgi:glycosyltransferase involved in cell wall biosynthesis
MKTQARVAFVVNRGPQSPLARRAGSFASRLGDSFDCRIVYRIGGKLGAVSGMVRAIAAARPDVCYVLDLASSGVLAAGLYKHATGTPFILDTGDAVVELGRVLGRGPAAIAATKALESYALRMASAVVVRGSFHRELLACRQVSAEFIPDGVDVDLFAPKEVPPPRQPGSPMVIGLVGSVAWVPSRQTCYGWELVELIRLLQPWLPVRGVLIGDGSGVEVLRQRCRDYGIADLVEFAVGVPFAEIPDRLRAFDISLSTQTNDLIGNVRTTGKLPEYLAAGRFVLASRVGEAARILPAQMLVEFRGESDPDYPARLADRVARLLAAGTDFSFRPECVTLAREHFDYDRLAGRVVGVLSELLGRVR